MNIDFFDKMHNIHSFVVLKDLFESWINEGVINEKSWELQIGYTSLIVHPSIYLTKDSAEREISAAKICHKIMIKYAKDKINKDLTSNDEKTKLAASILLLPPEKYILTVCSEFFNLHYFLYGLYSNYTEEQLANVNGDDYAKVWLNILSKGYHFKQTEMQIKEDRNHYNEALIMISKMHLSPMYKEKMDIENIKSLLKDYYHMNAGNGCMLTLMIFIISSITIACF